MIVDIGVADIVLLSAHFWLKGADEVRISFFEEDNVTPMASVRSA